MGSAFTVTLANIYMWEWEQSFVEHKQACGELYGRTVLLFLCGEDSLLLLLSHRYIDDGFMTTNLSFDQIKAKLDTADQKDPNIRG